MKKKNFTCSVTEERKVHLYLRINHVNIVFYRVQRTYQHSMKLAGSRAYVKEPYAITYELGH